MTVPAGGTATVTFEVTCDDIAGDLDVTASTTDTDLDPDGYDVQMDRADGGPVQTAAANDTVETTFDVSCDPVN